MAPAFVKTKADEKIWQEAKKSVHDSHPKWSETDPKTKNKFFADTNVIFHKIKEGKKNKA